MYRHVVQEMDAENKLYLRLNKPSIPVSDITLMSYTEYTVTHGQEILFWHILTALNI